MFQICVSETYLRWNAKQTKLRIVQYVIGATKVRPSRWILAEGR